MPKKKAPNSPFYYFMLEKKKFYQQSKLHYTMEQLKDIISPEWNKMDAETKRKYEETARLNRGMPFSGDRYASDGTRVSDNQREEERRNQQRQLTDLKIHMHICGDDSLEVFKERAAKQVHYIMCFNTLGYLQEQYIPIEVGIVEYSIKHGITGSYHKIIDYGTIPVGCVGEAKAHSEKTHQLLYSKVERDGRHHETFKEIMSFINASREDMPPIFTTSDAVSQTTGCLLWLAGRSGLVNVTQFEDGLRVWSSANLLYELRNGIGHSLPSVEMCKDRLQSVSFNYSNGNRCSFHEKKDSEYCALEYSKRIGFLLSELVGKLFDVKITDKHFPTPTSCTTYQVVSPPVAQPPPAVSVPRSVRAVAENNLIQRNKYDDLDDLEESSDIYSASNQTIGRGSRLPQHSPLPKAPMQHLSRNVAMMSLGTSVMNPASGIGRGRPSK